jgi:hypothetical protein
MGPIRGATATYTVIDECRQFGKNDILSLLDHKIREAEREIKADLHAQLYGRKPETNPLRQAIADAYDQVTMGQVIDKTLNTYKDRITEQIFTESPILKGLSNLRQEKDMTDSNTIARAAVDKRKEKRAKDRVEALGDYLDGIDWEDGDTISWSVRFKTNADKRYNYVAVKGGPSWYITGDSCRYGNDELTAKIVALSLDGKVEIDGWDDSL